MEYMPKKQIQTLLKIFGAAEIIIRFGISCRRVAVCAQRRKLVHYVALGLLI